MLDSPNQGKQAVPSGEKGVNVVLERITANTKVQGFDQKKSVKEWIEDWSPGMFNNPLRDAAESDDDISRKQLSDIYQLVRSYKGGAQVFLEDQEKNSKSFDEHTQKNAKAAIVLWRYLFPLISAESAKVHKESRGRAAASVVAPTGDASLTQDTPVTLRPKPLREHFDPETLEFYTPPLGRGAGATTPEEDILPSRPTRLGWWNRDARPQVSRNTEDSVGEVGEGTEPKDIPTPNPTESNVGTSEPVETIVTEIRNHVMSFCVTSANRLVGATGEHLGIITQQIEEQMRELQDQLGALVSHSSVNNYDQVQKEVDVMSGWIDDLEQGALLTAKAQDIVGAFQKIDLSDSDSTLKPIEQAFMGIVGHSMRSPYQEWGSRDSLRSIRIFGNTLYAQLHNKSIAISFEFAKSGAVGVSARAITAEVRDNPATQSPAANDNQYDSDVQILLTKDDVHRIISNFYDDFTDAIEGEERVQKDEVGKKFQNLYTAIESSQVYKNAPTHVPYPPLLVK